MKTIKLILLCFAVLFSIGNYAQETNNKWGYYLQIVDSSYIPQIINQDAFGYITLYTGVNDYDALFAQYRITEFYQGFPTSITDWLRQIYVLICDSGQVELGNELKDKYSNVIPLIETYYHNPVPTSTPEYISLNLNNFTVQKGCTLYFEGYQDLLKKVNIYDLKGLLLYSMETYDNTINFSNHIPKGIFIYRIDIESKGIKGLYYNH